ncbi:progesterone binding protein [Artomyces pyxidatus]|uniref:Progesterone binding protein n=1 Tax=Artomyces pyxidatus TaxID=48021 RepID=A0ACB8SQD6_9AGAM|nr:progesterone binding protein [Artomyces pyxidatus]
MQPARTDLAPPKDDPFTQEELKQFDGSDPSKPIYVAIKGTIFDVSHKRDTYGPGKSYNLFAGKDASKALGKSSLKLEDAIPDYSDLPENEMKVLNDWHSFFIKRYNIIGKVTDLPAAVANL